MTQDLDQDGSSLQGGQDVLGLDPWCVSGRTNDDPEVYVSSRTSCHQLSIAARAHPALTSLQHRIAEAITNFYDEGALLALCGLKFKVAHATPRHGPVVPGDRLTVHTACRPRPVSVACTV